MRSLLFPALVVAGLCAVSSAFDLGVWNRAAVFARRWVPVKADEASLTVSQRKAVVALIQKGGAPWGCDQADPAGEWKGHLRYRRVSLADTVRVVLVETGPGCGRGGQGSNGAMWVVRLERDSPTLLASSRQGFDGFLWSIEPSIAKGYRDVITGWHRGGGETGLAYFRFDGSRYRRIGSAVLRRDEKGVPTIWPEL